MGLLRDPGRLSLDLRLRHMRLRELRLGDPVASRVLRESRLILLRLDESLLGNLLWLYIGKEPTQRKSFRQSRAHVWLDVDKQNSRIHQVPHENPLPRLLPPPLNLPQPRPLCPLPRGLLSGRDRPGAFLILPLSFPLLSFRLLLRSSTRLGLEVGFHDPTLMVFPMLGLFQRGQSREPTLFLPLAFPGSERVQVGLPMEVLKDGGFRRGVCLWGGVGVVRGVERGDGKRHGGPVAGGVRRGGAVVGCWLVERRGEHGVGCCEMCYGAIPDGTRRPRSWPVIYRCHPSATARLTEAWADDSCARLPERSCLTRNLHPHLSRPFEHVPRARASFGRRSIADQAILLRARTFQGLARCARLEPVPGGIDPSMIDEQAFATWAIRKRARARREPTFLPDRKGGGDIYTYARPVVRIPCH